MISKDELIEQITALAGLYKQRFKKSLGVTAEVGEYKAAKLLNLKLEQGNINKGFDALDTKGKRVQIKSRIYTRKGERTGVFGNYDFDYALLVLLSGEYEVLGIYRMGREAVEREIQKQSYKRHSLPINRFKKLGKCVYGTDS